MIFSHTDFLNGYLEGMLFANTWIEDGSDDIKSLGDTDLDLTIWDFSEDDLVTVRDELQDFLNMADDDGITTIDLINQAMDTCVGYTSEQAGIDYALTRNRHGAGFWDRGLGVVGELLTEQSHSMGESNCWVLVSEENGVVLHYGF